MRYMIFIAFVAFGSILAPLRPLRADQKSATFFGRAVAISTIQTHSFTTGEDTTEIKVILRTTINGQTDDFAIVCPDKAQSTPDCNSALAWLGTCATLTLPPLMEDGPDYERTIETTMCRYDHAGACRSVEAEIYAFPALRFELRAVKPNKLLCAY